MLPPFVFLVLSTYYVTVAYSNNEALKNGLNEEMGQMNVFTAFLVLGVVLCQSDFKVFMFFMVPVYIVADIFIDKLRAKNYLILLQKLPEEY